MPLSLSLSDLILNMFHKAGSSTIGGRKDVPLRKSDRRRLRDRVVNDALLLVVGGANNRGGDDGAVEIVGGDSSVVVAECRGEVQASIIGSSSCRSSRAIQLVDDVILGNNGDIVSRKLRLMDGTNVTLFLRTPSSIVGGNLPTLALNNNATSSSSSSNTVDCNSFPIVWPYQKTIQPILLEIEDGERKVHLIPLLPLLMSFSPSESNGRKVDSINNDDDGIPNIVVHSEVSKFLCRGADLMRSGMRSFPPPWTLRRSGGIVTVSVIGNPQPLAVGMLEHGLFREYCYNKNNVNRGTTASTTTVDSWKIEATKLVGPGKKGVGVMIVNCYGDDLWKESLPPKTGSFGTSNIPSMKGDVINPLGGGSYDDGNYGNLGFVEGRVVVPIRIGGEDSDKDSCCEDGQGDDDAQEKAIFMAEMVEQMSLSDPVEEGEFTTGDTDHETSTSIYEDTKVDHDEILLDACYASLLLLLSSKTPLSMPVSTFYAKHLLAAVPTTGPRLDMKLTSYKKIGPFLKEIECRGVIRLGASKDGKDRCAFLKEIVRDNPHLLRFKKNWRREIEANGGDVCATMNPPISQDIKLSVVDLFIVPRHFTTALLLDKDAVMATNAKTDERKGTGFLTKTEVTALINEYIEKESLTDPTGKGHVLVNGPLCDALYRTKKTNSDYPTSVSRKDLIEKWIDRMDKGHALVQMPGSKVLRLGRGHPTPVEIEVEFRQGNRKKFLTHIRGMEEYGVDGTSLSQDVSHRFACSSTIESNPVGRPALKKCRVELVLQGHLSEELTALLTGDETLTSHGGVKGSEYNLPKSVINVTLRKGVPVRKKR